MNEITNTPPQTRPQPRRRPRPGRAGAGMAMAATLLIVLLLMAATILGFVLRNGSTGPQKTSGGVMQTTDSGLRSVRQRVEAVHAFNAAESGVAYTMQWLSSLGKPPSQNTTINPADINQFAAPSRMPADAKDGRAEVVIPQAPAAPGAPQEPRSLFRVCLYPSADNPSNVLKQYLIESVGVCGGQRRVLRVLVRQSSFSKFAFFESFWNGGTWDPGERSFDGPVHINNFNYNNADPNDTSPSGDGLANVGVRFYTSGSPLTDNGPMFKYKGRDAFTTAAPRLRILRDSGSTPATLDANEWKFLTEGGADSVRAAEQPIPMPENNDMQRYAAFGLFGVAKETADPQLVAQETLAKATVGVTVPNDGANGMTGGIYINGDVDQMTLDVPRGTDGQPTSTTTQTIRVKQRKNTSDPADPYTVDTVITIDPTTNKTTVAREEFVPKEVQVQVPKEVQQQVRRERQVWKKVNGRWQWVTEVYYETVTVTVMETVTQIVPEKKVSPPVVYNGTGNGVVFVNGNIGRPAEGFPKPDDRDKDASGVARQDTQMSGIGGIEGTIADNVTSAGTVVRKNSMTIATASDKSVCINGNVQALTARQTDPATPYRRKDEMFYSEDKDNTDFRSRAGMLGLVSRRIQISDKNSKATWADRTLGWDSTEIKDSGKALTQVRTDVAGFALRTFDVLAPGGRSRSGQRHINNGCYIQNFGGNTQGMRMVRSYDWRLANDPPPFFPTTGNKYEVLSWRRVAETLE